MSELQAVRGMHDVLPEELPYWRRLEEVFYVVSSRFGYEEIRTPIVEYAQLYVRSVGEASDIVHKEMYTFADRSGDQLALRPELTAGVVRALVQHGLLQRRSVWRLWYYGPAFRYERPQKGRYRQFHQYGAECFGSPYPESDVDVLLLAITILQQLGITGYEVQLNTLGSTEVRQRYRQALRDYFSSVRLHLSPDSQQRLERNPLRILDSKHPDDQPWIEQAPVVWDFLDAESRSHFEYVHAAIAEVGGTVVLNPRLVRGLDYYTHTVFEFVSPRLGAQNAFGGGGRYDKLVESFGGPSLPAVGFAFGVERLLLLMERPPQEAMVQIYVATTGAVQAAQQVVRLLRGAGYSAVADLQRRSLKTQLRDADRLGATLAVIVGDSEWQRGSVLLRHLRESAQWECALPDLLPHVRQALSR
ncbi:MAG: histidine--tRNA ligase [Candidatus Kapabacteria bacterium]|nr:histidine--tRNA ligase [Candidatus Kapabacteria bacterium]MDW8224461.1 histidine--tRNA ligase [Bacteroidota bacterium]